MKNGYTFVEIFVVLALITILLALTVPGIFDQMPRHRLNGAARQVKAELVATRMRAVAQNNEFKVFFLDDHRYLILDDDDNDGTADPTEAKAFHDIHQEYPGVSLSSNRNPIFRPGGTASNLATIQLTNSSGSKTITISIAGRVKSN